jgi:NTE family protein
MMRRALVLAGGGAKGSFQVGALRELERYGVQDFDAVYGVSVGALNAAGYVRGGVNLLESVWFGIREQDVHKKHSWPGILWRVARGKLGVYDNTPLLATIRRYMGDGPLPARVGYVDLRDGEYRSVPATPMSVWASSTIPVVWEPMDGHFVDGGVRNMTPLAEALYSAIPTRYGWCCATGWTLNRHPRPRTSSTWRPAPCRSP